MSEKITQKTDEQIMEEWLQQSAPKPESLTDKDIFYAMLANSVISDYLQRSKWHKFRFDNTDMVAYESMDSGWEQTMEYVKRGVAVLNGYLLWHSPRTSIFRTPEPHKEAAISDVYPAGYVAMEEQHRYICLIPADDLITIGAAAEIIYSENTQSKRVMLKEDIIFGYLQMFRDPLENNPQKNKRVSRRETVKVAAQRNRE